MIKYIWSLVCHLSSPITRCWWLLPCWLVVVHGPEPSRVHHEVAVGGKAAVRGVWPVHECKAEQAKSKIFRLQLLETVAAYLHEAKPVVVAIHQVALQQDAVRHHQDGVSGHVTRHIEQLYPLLLQQAADRPQLRCILHVVIQLPSRQSIDEG